MISVALSLAVLFVGLVIYLGTEKPKASKIGEIMFWTGLLAFLLTSGPLITVFRR